jgi:hypothetical protein
MFNYISAADYVAKMVDLFFSRKEKDFSELTSALKIARSEVHDEIMKEGEEWSDHSKMLVHFGAIEALLELIHEADKQIFHEEDFEILKDDTLCNIAKCLCGNPGKTAEGIAKKIGMQQINLVIIQVEKLIAAKFVLESCGRYYLTHYGEAVMEEWEARQ